MTAIDLFAGAGGLSEGAKAAGFSIAVAIERDSYAGKTYQLNHPNVAVLNVDIRSIDPSKLTLPNKKLDAIIAGPPCQPFSTSNQKTRRDDNPLNNLLFEPVRFIRFFEPNLIILENVEGLSIGSRKKYLDAICERLQRLGYHYQVIKVTGGQAGIPQHRTRLFIVGTKKKIRDIVISCREQPSVRDAISDLPVLRNGSRPENIRYRSPTVSQYANLLRGDLQCCTGHLVTQNAAHIVERYRYIPPGGNWSDIPRNKMRSYADVTRCHTGIYHRLQWDVPAKVIGNFRKNMLVHPSQNRGLSVREAARLQSFKDSYQFWGSIGKQQQQVGNAVPPLMAVRRRRELLMA